LQLVFLVFLVAFVTFILSAWIPGDFYTLHELDSTVRQEAIEQLRQTHGLDQPAYVQYARWLKNLLQLDLGISLSYQRPVSEVVIDALTKTLWIGVPALFIGVLGGILLGVIHAIHREKRIGSVLDFLSTFWLSLPSLVLGLVALLLASRTQWFPLGSMSSSQLENPLFWEWLIDRIHHLILPVACLSIPVLVSVERIQFAAARTTSEELHLRSARARGLSLMRVFGQHLLRPSLNPVISTSGPLFGAVLSGSLVLEVIFAWPGLGQITYDALSNNDQFLLVGCVVGAGFLLVLGNLLSDFLLFLLDPRTRTTSQVARS